MPWKCTICGYENPDDANFCLRCGAQKPAQPTIEPTQQPASTEQQPQQQPEQLASQQQPASTTPPEQVQVASPQQTPTPPAQQTPPEQQIAQSPPQTPQAVAQQVVTQPSQTQPQHKYYLLFIQTPYAGLINQKVPLNFDIFPSISIGRSPENVIIVPDPEVSRRHAVVSLEAGELYIEDLNSTNGTYVYDGKLFQPIKGKQKIAPNSIIKLGNQTIVKFVAE